MPTIHFLPDNRTVPAKPGDSILKASLRSKIPHAHACRGQGRCSTCRVVILEGSENCTARTAQELKLAGKLHLDATIRLACQTKLLGDVRVRRPVLDEVDIQLTDQLKRSGKKEYVGEERKLAILFSDISGYTEFAEPLPPYDVVHVLNRYYFQMNRIITENQGIASDFVGDGILALFGIEDENGAALSSVKAGLQMFQAVEKLNNYLLSMYNRSFQIRLGLHVGRVVVGTFGALSQKKISAIGDAVNLASRIEQANKAVHTRFLISHDAFQEVRDEIRVGKCHPTEIRGKKGKYDLYEVIGLNSGV